MADVYIDPYLPIDDGYSYLHVQKVTYLSLASFKLSWQSLLKMTPSVESASAIRHLHIDVCTNSYVCRIRCLSRGKV